MHIAPRNRARRHLLNRLGRALAIVTQLVLLFAPIAESREERLLDPHVEAPRAKAHPGHHATTCAECTLLSMHGRSESRAQLPAVIRGQSVCDVARAAHANGADVQPSNGSRAPPICL